MVCIDRWILSFRLWKILMAKKGIFTFCVRGFPGSNKALAQLEGTTGLTRHFVIESMHPRGVDIKFFALYLREQTPSLVIFGGWHPVYDALIKSLPRSSRVAVYWTSSPAQTDTSSEAQKLADVLRNKRIDKVLFSSREFAMAINSSREGLYLPVTMSGEDARQETFDDEGLFKISLFFSSAEYRRKNLLNSLIATSLLKKKYILYLNRSSRLPGYGAIARKLGVNYTDFGWMRAEKYQNVLSTVDLGLQVSLSESYNYVAAEHFLRGKPVIVSRAVPVVDDFSPALKKRLIVDDFDNPFEIKEKILFFMNNPQEKKRIGNLAYQEFSAINKSNIRMAKKLLRKFL